MNYRFLGWVSLALAVVITAPYWLRKLNAWTIKTKDKRFFSVLKFIRKLHRPLAALLLGIAAWHGWGMLGRLRLHTGSLLYLSFIVTGVLGGIYWLNKDKRAFKGHKVMALVTVLLAALHLLWPSALWHIFRV